jgi:hypothetical protein
MALSTLKKVQHLLARLSGARNVVQQFTPLAAASTVEGAPDSSLRTLIGFRVCLALLVRGDLIGDSNGEGLVVEESSRGDLPKLIVAMID